MRKIFLGILAFVFIAFYINAFAAYLNINIPNIPPSRVVDLAHLLTSNEEQSINIKLRKIHDITNGTEIQILTIPSLAGQTIEDVSLNISRKWKLGKSGINNGILILIVASEHKYRLEVGYGLEAQLPDGYIGNLGRQFFVPNFKNGNYYLGLNLLIDNLNKQLSLNSTDRIAKVRTSQLHNTYFNLNKSLMPFIIGGFLILFIIGIIFWFFYPNIISGLGPIIFYLLPFLREKADSIFKNSDNDDIGGGGNFGGGGSSGNY